MLKGKQSFEYSQLLIVRLIREDLDVATYFSPIQVSRYPSGLTMVSTYQSYSLLRRLCIGVSETSFYTTQSMIPEDKYMYNVFYHVCANNYFYLHKICEHSRANPFPCMNSSINPVNRSMATFLKVANFQQKNVSSLKTFSNCFQLDIWMILVYLFEPFLMCG